jgi:Excisionase from transposon Tn916
MNHTEKTIPVWEKYSLNVSEAAEYYGIGEKRLRQIAGENEGADFHFGSRFSYSIQKEIV